jgi:hypothetical protein
VRLVGRPPPPADPSQTQAGAAEAGHAGAHSSRLADFARAIDIDVFDVPVEATYRGSFEWTDDCEPNMYIPLEVWRQGEKRDWDMEEILFLLNNIGDNWELRRSARWNEHASDAFNCTFVRSPRPAQGSKEPEIALHIRVPLNSPDRMGAAHRHTRGPDVSPNRDHPHQGPHVDQPWPGANPHKPQVSVSLWWILEEGNEAVDPTAGDSAADQSQGDPNTAHTPNDREAEVPPDAPESTGTESPARKLWTTRCRDGQSFIGSRGRKKNESHEATFVDLEGTFPVRASSHWIRHSDMILIHEKHDFGWPLLHFVKAFRPDDEHRDPYILARLRESLALVKRVSRPNHSARDFREVPGWLELRVAPLQDSEKWERYQMDDGTWVSIISGIWIHPQAPSIMTRNSVDGLVMDTTFEVIRLYHTAILIAVSHNVGIPLAYAFGPKESIELYDSFYTAFDDLGINLRTYILESDQGSALKSVGTRHPRHLFCLRHVLKSLQTNGCGRFGCLVGNLIRARAQKELNLLVELYTPDFNQVCQQGGVEKEQLLRALKKVGLVMHNGEIRCEDPEGIRWSQVSMLERIGTNMPSTSNTIECMNGHLNGKTPRHNCFWGSQHRLAETFTHKIDNFTLCVIHNAKYEFRKVDRRAGLVSDVQMTAELVFFQTDEDHCLCGETVFTTSMYRVDVHCSHRVVFWRRNLRAIAQARQALPPGERGRIPIPGFLPPEDTSYLATMQSHWTGPTPGTIAF